MSKVNYLPEGYSNIIPYLTIKDAGKAIDFYKKVLGAKELTRFNGPDGKVGHAELQIGDSKIMIGEECVEMGMKSPLSVGGSPVTLLVYVENVDKIAEAAVAAGAKLTQKVEDKFYGDRSGIIADPFGHIWNVSTHVEDVSDAEMRSRAEKMMKQHKPAA